MIKVNSRLPDSLPLHIDTADLEFCNVDYMCIKEPKGQFLVPQNYAENLVMKGDIIGKIYNMLDRYNITGLDVDNDCYWYLTVKKGFINPSAYQTKNEWHIDGFLRDDYNFSWTDALPTLIAEGQFEVTPDRYVSLNEYDKQVQTIVKSEPHTLYHLSRECVHKPMLNESNSPIIRTFVKITITKRLFDSRGNAWNYLIPHIKPKGERTNFVNK